MTDAGKPPQERLRHEPSFGDEFVDFGTFVLRPRLAPRLPTGARAGSWRMSREWLGGISAGRLLRWVMVLWLVNLAIFGPLASGVADLAGAYNRLESMHLAWWKAVLLAPVLEELLFRFFLRRPAVGAWMVPALTVGIFMRPWSLALSLALVICLAGFLLIRHGLSRRAYSMPWRAMRRYARYFPFIFHAAVLVFALVHLGNFNFGGGMPMWAALPLMVLPQWVTGLVLGWMRVRFGIGSSMALHGLFNAGPMTLMWLATQYGPGLTAT